MKIMLPYHQDTIVDRFMSYVQVDTESDSNSTSFPTTEKQKDLLRILLHDFQAIDIADVSMDDYGYVYAHIPSNIDRVVPAICFLAHVDTSADCKGSNVVPRLHKNYQGEDIAYPKDPTLVLSPKDFPYLLQHIGSDIVTASGDTLLGADDKAGVAILMDFAHFLITHPHIQHGDICIVFNPDEEVGRGMEKINVKKINASYGYTIDAGVSGQLEDECFYAYMATIHIRGVSIHPGYAKNKLVNAIKIASWLIEQLPKTFLCPETTADREGFVHPVSIVGGAEEAVIKFIVRDFNMHLLEQHVALLSALAEETKNKFPLVTITMKVQEQYKNMKEMLDKYPCIIENAKKAYIQAGVTPIVTPIRGGTDGSKLSFMGIPTANIFAGMQAIHSRKEWVGIKDMRKTVEVLTYLVQEYIK